MKKKNQQFLSIGSLSFILFWALVIGFLQSGLGTYSDLGRGVYDFVFYRFPAALHDRLWVVYLVQGIVVGLGIGLAQKLALQSLQPMRLQYWVRVTVFLTAVAKLMEYVIVRFIYPLISWPTSIPFDFLVPSFTQLILLLIPWWFLRRHFRHTWLYLLLAIPNLAVASSYSFYPFVPVLQALLAACVLVWLNHQSFPHENIKQTTEAEGRLNDLLAEEEDADEESQIPVALSHTSEAKL